jgi:hypothetical protein
MKDKTGGAHRPNARRCFSLFILHPSAFILSINVHEETSEYMGPLPCADFRQCR